MRLLGEVGWYCWIRAMKDAAKAGLAWKTVLKRAVGSVVGMRLLVVVGMVVGTLAVVALVMGLL